MISVRAGNESQNFILYICNAHYGAKKHYNRRVIEKASESNIKYGKN